MVKIKLREKDINKLSSVTQLSTEVLLKLASMNMIDVIEARNLLILTDWRILKRGKRYTTSKKGDCKLTVSVK